MPKGESRPELRCGTYGGHRQDGTPCGLPVLPGTKRCYRHSGTDQITARSKGQVVLEIRKWGLTDQPTADVDLDEIMLRLVSQSAARAELYAHLLAQAYDAAEALAQLQTAGNGRNAVVVADLLDTATGYDPDGVDPERQRITADLRRIFSVGGVGVLIGWTYAATKDGDVFAVGEAIRGLAQLEALERDRCMTFTVKAKAAGLAERQVRVAEALASQLVGAVYAMLGELGLSRDDPRVREVVASKLRELAGGDGDGYGGVIDGVVMGEGGVDDAGF